MKKSILNITGVAVAAALCGILCVTCNDGGAGGGEPDGRVDEFVSKFNRKYAVVVSSANTYSVLSGNNKRYEPDVTVGEYVPGSMVTINAGTPTNDFCVLQFKNWTAPEGSGVIFADTSKSTTTFTMPANSVTVTANFERLYKLNVSGGTGSGNYPADTVVTITANPAPEGQRFKRWTGGYFSEVEGSSGLGHSIAPYDGTFLGFNTIDSAITFTMIRGRVGLTANFESVLPAPIPNIEEKSSNSITLQWNEVPNATGYYVYRSETESGVYIKIDSTSSTSYKNNGLQSITTYYYKVSAYNDDGEGLLSSYVSATTGQVPSAPTGVKASAKSSSSITVSWTAVPNATGYYVYRTTTPSGTHGKLDSTSSPSYTDAWLVAASTYYYRVSAYNSDGESSLSSYDSATTSPAAETGEDCGYYCRWKSETGSSECYVIHINDVSFFSCLEAVEACDDYGARYADAYCSGTQIGGNVDFSSVQPISALAKSPALRVYYSNGKVEAAWGAAVKISGGTAELINSADGATVSSAIVKASGKKVTATIIADAVPAGMYYVRIGAKGIDGKRIVEQTPISIVK